jgi:hypothetical protein
LCSTSASADTKNAQFISPREERSFLATPTATHGEHHEPGEPAPTARRRGLGTAAPTIAAASLCAHARTECNIRVHSLAGVRLSAATRAKGERHDSNDSKCVFEWLCRFRRTAAAWVAVTIIEPSVAARIGVGSAIGIPLRVAIAVAIAGIAIAVAGIAITVAR